MQNHARPGDIAFTMSVSGNSPNWWKAFAGPGERAAHRRRGRQQARQLAESAEEVIVIDSSHYGHVEDGQMAICHMLCYAFMENAALSK